jgi:PAS domain S-box-containing protein
MEKDNRSYNILVVEDNPGDCMLIEEFLEEQIIAPHLTFASSYARARDEIEAQTPKKSFDVILLDLTLPDVSGEPLIREILGLQVKIPVIVLTGYADMRFSVRSLSLGVADYILKDDLNASILYKSIIYSIERKSFINELKESERRYRELFQLTPLPMWVLDLKTQNILDVNEAATLHYGYTREEFLDLSARDIRPKKERDNRLEPLNQFKNNKNKGKKLREMGVYRHQKKNGKIINVEVKAGNIIFNHKSARLILANDITENLRYINAIEDQNARLRDIAWIQSHVVRAPLSRIMGLVDLFETIREEGKSAPETEMDLDEMAQILSYIMESAHELDEVIRDIMNKTSEIDLDLKKQV